MFFQKNSKCLSLQSIQKKLKISPCLSSLALKLIGVISMMSDHIGVVFFPEMEFFRFIGRLAFIIFSFQLVEGFERTSNVNKYKTRILIMAIISEPIFDMVFYNKLFFLNHQNIFIELLIGLETLCFLKKAKDKPCLFQIFIVVLFAFLATILKCDYSAFGIILISMFYILQDNLSCLILSTAMSIIMFEGVFELPGLLAFIPILFYNRRESNAQNKDLIWIRWIFYWFYPLHLLILYVLNRY